MVKQYEQITSEPELQEIAKTGLEKLRNVLKYTHSDDLGAGLYSYRYSSMEAFYAVSESVMQRFINGEENVEPSVKSMLRMIAGTDIGAGALGLLDISSEEETKIYDIISLITDAKETPDTPCYIKEVISKAFDAISSPHIFESYLLSMRISTFIKVTRYFGLSVQDIFGGNFYRYCDELYNND